MFAFLSPLSFYLLRSCFLFFVSLIPFSFSFPVDIFLRSHLDGVKGCVSRRVTPLATAYLKAFGRISVGKVSFNEWKQQPQFLFRQTMRLVQKCHSLIQPLPEHPLYEVPSHQANLILFHYYDKDGSGYLDKEEVEFVMKDICIRAEKREQEARAMKLHKPYEIQCRMSIFCHVSVACSFLFVVFFHTGLSFSFLISCPFLSEQSRLSRICHMLILCLLHTAFLCSYCLLLCCFVLILLVCFSCLCRHHVVCFFCSSSVGLVVLFILPAVFVTSVRSLMK